jgi:hypothetical protein
MLLVLAILICTGSYLVGVRYLHSISNHTTSEEVFARYLTTSDNSELLRNATNIQAKELSMGQGVYLRFEASRESVIEFLEDFRSRPDSYHYPYQAISCQDFFTAYPDWVEGWLGYKWWRPREVASPECYVTRGCEGFLFDNESETVYYYFFPDFLGKDYVCVGAK